MAVVMNQETMMAAIQRAIEAEIKRAVDEATEQVINRTRESVRQRLGQIACGLVGQYEVEERAETDHQRQFENRLDQMTRVLICGGRDLDRSAVFNYLNQHAQGDITEALGSKAWPVTAVIHGGARGADEGAGMWAEREGIKPTVFKADWRKHGKAAGPIRNRKMLEEGKPDLVIAFQGGKGTASMIALAREVGVRVLLTVA